MFIRTERLFLRPTWPDDLDEFVSLLSDQAVARNIGTKALPDTAERAEEIISAPRDPLLPHFFINLRSDDNLTLIGSIGLGLVVLRNMLERRNELAMLRAVGFNKATLKRMVFYEHSGLMLAGLVSGAVAAILAVAPALKAPGATVPYLSLALTVAAIAISGVLWIWIAAALALSGRMLDALRSE